MSVELTDDLIARVRRPVSEHARRTPLLQSEWLSRVTGAQVHLKCENLQRTGSFKLRGALAAVSLLTPSERRAGVVTTSAGNHGLGLARAARIFEVPCTVVVSQSVPRVKEEGIRKEGATVVRSPHDGYDDTEAWMREQTARWGEAVFVSAFDDPAVIAGNGGTTMLEILEELPRPDWVLFPCGGGGLSGGAGWVLREHRIATHTVGINTEASPGMWLSWRDGRAHLRLPSAPTLAEGLEGGVSERTYRLTRDVLEDIWVVPEARILEAIREIARHERMIVEGSAAVGVAALLGGKKVAGQVVVVLTGSNIDPERLRESMGTPSE
jgi:threonine dehydratase